MKPTLRCILLFLFACGLTPAHATTFRLDSTKTWIRGTSYTYAPGDTFCLAAGKRPFQYFKGFHGSESKPLVIRNCAEGQAVVGKGTNYGMVLDSVTYIHLTGTGTPGVTYGIWLDSTAAGTGLGITNLSHHVEVDHLRISHPNFAGIMAKKDYSGSPPDPAPVMDGIHIHHNWIHDTGGEGMYLGETKSPGMLLTNLEVHHNLIQRTGWDLLQIANSVKNIRIHHNVMLDGGLAKEPVQANGIQIGDQSRDVRIDHNIVKNVAENSLICMGSGSIVVDSNWFEGSGGKQALFVDHRTFYDSGSTIRFSHNWWSRANTESVWRIYNEKVRIAMEDNLVESAPKLLVLTNGATTANTDTLRTLRRTIAPLVFVDSAGGNFHIPTTSPYAAWDLGFGTSSDVSVLRTRRTQSFMNPLPTHDALGRVWRGNGLW
ncbi:MAG: right-handed parallel beta-helix repeat-containing protein [Fibrobacterota bacterium]|nr:right-handed parallel beta-helix repeat-containing protein [Fibrobacterota bacterium]QQS07598.1 MAG: right-handed parallel beta-helix repeat-containing protein [Fibrobacterota bacterium]